MLDTRPRLIVRRLGSLTKPPCLAFRICRQLVSDYGGLLGGIYAVGSPWKGKIHCRWTPKVDAAFGSELY